MNHRIWGRAGLQVSEIGLGGEWLNGLTQAESTAIIETALEYGINYMDVFMPQAPTRDRGWADVWYCSHCQPCPAHLDIAAVTKFLDLARQQKTVPDTVMEHHWALPATADDCLMCGRCESNCPSGVNVRENMRQAKEVFRRYDQAE